MSRSRSIACALAAVAAAGAMGCGPMHRSRASRRGQALIVLLPDSDTGLIGRASVSNESGSVDLTGQRAAARATPDRRPRSLGTMSRADVKRIFGEALSALPPAPERFTLFFQFDSDELTDESRGRLPDVLKSVKARSVPDVVVVGHTDTMGPPPANFELGLKRATAVRNLLVGIGLDRSAIEVISHGEADLLVQTPDETPEPRNRRVEIAVR